MKTVVITFTFFLLAPLSFASELKIAVASNFITTAKLITKKFTEKTGNKVILSNGSTGKLYAQIKNGAPYDLFMAADQRRPELLVQENLAIKDSRYSYAIGKLVLWSRNMDINELKDKSLTANLVKHIALANPKHAPYGKAARQVLRKLDLESKLNHKLVMGENINQTFQFVMSANAQLGFISYSQYLRKGLKGSIWDIPASLYESIKQDLVILNQSQQVGLAQSFVKFMKTPEMRKIVLDSGYLAHKD